MDARFVMGALFSKGAPMEFGHSMRTAGQTEGRSERGPKQSMEDITPSSFYEPAETYLVWPIGLPDPTDQRRELRPQVSETATGPSNQ